MDYYFKLVALYEYNDTWQMVDTKGTVHFQGSKKDCRALVDLENSYLLEALA